MGQRGFRRFLGTVEGGLSSWATVFNANTGYGRYDIQDDFIKISKDPLEIRLRKPVVV